MSNENFKIDAIFASPLYSAILDDLTLVQTEFNDRMQYIQFDNTPETWGKTHKISKADNQDTFAQDAISKYQLNHFEKVLKFHIEQYCSAMGKPIVSYKRDSWFTLFEYGDYGHIHNHMDADISGCYYYSTSGNDGRIFFESPNPFYKISPYYTHLGGRQFHDPEVGKLILFPGWLEHGIETNTTDSRRISLSFNIYFKNSNRDF
jgi:uncharacterized protein (TIGR02466 family)